MILRDSLTPEDQKVIASQLVGARSLQQRVGSGLEVLLPLVVDEDTKADVAVMMDKSQELADMIYRLYVRVVKEIPGRQEP